MATCEKNKNCPKLHCLDAKVLFRMISVQFSMESASSSGIKRSPERDMYVLVKPCITLIYSESSYASSLGETVLRVTVKF